MPTDFRFPRLSTGAQQLAVHAKQRKIFPADVNRKITEVLDHPDAHQGVARAGLIAGSRKLDVPLERINTSPERSCVWTVATLRVTERRLLSRRPPGHAR